MPETIIHIAQGKILNRQPLANLFKLEDGSYLVSVKSYKKRSVKQNAYWWGCLVPIFKEGLRSAGYDEVKTDDDAHEVIKHMFLKKDIVNKETGEVIASIAGGTAKLLTTEFNALIDEAVKWASEWLGVQIPLPNEPLVMFYEYDNDVQATIISSNKQPF